MVSLGGFIRYKVGIKRISIKGGGNATAVYGPILLVILIEGCKNILAILWPITLNTKSEGLYSTSTADTVFWNKDSAFGKLSI